METIQTESGVTIVRTTLPDGSKKDEVSYLPDQAAEAIEQAAEVGLAALTLVIPDPNDEVSELHIALPEDTMQIIAAGQVDLEIHTVHTKLIVPKETLALLGLDGETQFYISPNKRR